MFHKSQGTNTQYSRLPCCSHIEKYRRFILKKDNHNYVEPDISMICHGDRLDDGMRHRIKLTVYTYCSKIEENEKRDVLWQ